MARIDLTQLDDFAPDFLDTVKEGDVAVWKESEENFVPETQIVFRRIFMLMGA